MSKRPSLLISNGATEVTFELLRKADTYRKAGNRAGAIAELDRLLRRFPNHTSPLHNMAALYAEGGDYDVATGIQRLAVFIEPNYRRYRLALLAYASNTPSQLRLLRDEFLKLHEVFPYAHDLDADELDLLLTIGEPAEAKARFQIAELSAENNACYQSAIDAAFIGKKRATEVLATLEHSFLKGELLPVDRRLTLLEDAYSVYDRDPFLCLNLGLTRNLAQPTINSLTLFEFAGAVLPYEFGPLCYVNAALGCIKRQDFDSATQLLFVAQLRLSELCAGKPPELRMIPGAAEFICPRFTLELPDELVPTLKPYLSGVSNELPRPIAELIDLMVEANAYARQHCRSTPEQAKAAIASAVDARSENL